MKHEIEQQDIDDSIRTYDDRLEEAETMSNLKYTYDNYGGINL